MGRRSEAYAGSGPVGGGGVATTGAADAVGAASTGGGASGMGVCATGAGESNTCAWAIAGTPADGVVGVAGGTGVAACDTGCGGATSAAAENGPPDCIPLSKLCIRFVGVGAWVGVGGASGAPAGDATGDAGSGPVATGGNRGVAPAAADRWGGRGVDGIDVRSGIGCPGVLRLLLMMFAGDAGAAAACGACPGCRPTSVFRLLPVIVVSDPGAAPGGDVADPCGLSAGAVLRLLLAMFASEPGGLSSNPCTSSVSRVWSWGRRNISPTLAPLAKANCCADWPVDSSSRIRCIAASTLPPYFAAATLASPRYC